jgi:ABC-type sugar transport system ATPase subunit
MVNGVEFNLYNEVFYFEGPENGSLQKNNELKEFLLFIKSQNIKGPLKFSFAPEAWSLTSNLNIKESIMLDSISTSFSSGQNLEFEDYLEKIDNPYLTEMQNQIGDLSRLPSNLDFRTRKLATLFKAFIKQCPFLFLQNPEKYLRDSDLSFLNKVIELEVKNGRTILMSSGSFSSFQNVITRIVGRNPQKEFVVKKRFQKETKTTGSVLNFHSGDLKKAA